MLFALTTHFPKMFLLFLIFILVVFKELKITAGDVDLQWMWEFTNLLKKAKEAAADS